MIQRFSRFPGDRSIADEILDGCVSLELKIIKFREGETCLTYKMEGELLATGDVADALCDEETNRSPAKAQRLIAELLAELLDDNGKGGKPK